MLNVIKLIIPEVLTTPLLGHNREFSLLPYLVSYLYIYILMEFNQKCLNKWMENHRFPYKSLYLRRFSRVVPDFEQAQKINQAKLQHDLRKK